MTEYLADAKTRELSEVTLYKLDVFPQAVPVLVPVGKLHTSARIHRVATEYGGNLLFSRQQDQGRLQEAGAESAPAIP